MGVVYKAEDTRLGCKVALKFQLSFLEEALEILGDAGRACMRLRILSLCLMSSVAFEIVLLATPLQDDACIWFHKVLESVPHQTLSVDSGTHKSVYDGKTYRGCEIRFETNDLLLSGREVPKLDATEGGELYRLGWQMDNSVAADGPGTSLFAVRRESWLCVVRESQPAYLDDSGDLVQSDTLQITVQCHQD